MIGFCRAFLMLAAAQAVVVAQPLDEKVVRSAAAQIDRMLTEDLNKARLIPEARVNDGIFVRRAYLGIVGRVPTAEEAKTFIEEPSLNKRAQLVDKLVASAGFDSHLFNWVADLLRLQSRGGREKSGLGWHVWLRESLAQDKPWDAMVGEMLSASGHSVGNPAVGYYLRDRNMQLDNFSNTMQVFLGQQMGCAQCHDHPFADWTQYDYYQMASFGGGIEYRSEDLQKMVHRVANDLREGKIGHDAQQQRQQKQRSLREAGNQLRPFFRQLSRDAIADNPKAELRLPKDYKYDDGKPGQVVAPATLFGPIIKDVAPEDRQEAFAAWVTSPDNPYFTKTIVNRLWARTFGAPLYDSIDDLSAQSRTFHPELARTLEKYMQDCNYDMRQFSRILFRTQLFERACMAKEPVSGEPAAFRGMVLRRMTAEQLHDSFIVLHNGGIDDQPAENLQQQWERHVNAVTTLFKAQTRDLLMLAESAREGEGRLRMAQEAMRVARQMLSDAKDAESRMDAQAAMKQAREKIREARQQANPLMSMQMMGGRDRVRNGQLRASDLPAPFNPGTLVRQFGGSDRETPSSSRADATVPQALALLNSWQTHPLAGGKKDHLGDQLTKLNSAQQRLEYLFLAIFGEKPDRNETQRYIDLASDSRSVADLAVAMINSKRFLFIQ